jgi:hypothetical protein
MDTEAKLTALMILVALDVARGCTIEERRELAGMLIGIAERYGLRLLAEFITGLSRKETSRRWAPGMEK